MSRCTDNFGEPIAEGDIILSASTTSGTVKIGRAVFGSNSLLVEHDYYSRNGHEDTSAMSRSAAGFNVVLLRRVDGSLPPIIRAVVW